ncbi:MAG TPA: hypothetical protein VH855_09870 [Acetobacteraceae bacterium]
MHQILRQIRRDQRLLHTEIIAAVLSPNGGSADKLRPLTEASPPRGLLALVSE